MPLTKVTPPNLHQTVKTMVTTMVNETAIDSADAVTLINANAIDSADATLIINSNIAAKSTSDLSEGTNLYYTDARVDARLSGGSVGNIVTTGYLAGPATFTIDPAAVGDNTGTVVIAGSLQVDGTTTTINSTTMTVDDLNLTLASGAANAAAASGAGITVDGASAQLTYDAIQDRWNMNKGLELISSPLVVGTGTTDVGRVENSAGVFSLYAYTGRQIAFGNDTNGEHVRIDADGNVGIGTASPLSGLHISDGTNAGSPQNASRKATLMIDAGATASADLQFMVRNGFNSHIFFGDAADPNVGMLWYDHSTNHMNFSANTNHTMTIDDNGRVGIGATSPTSKLEIYNDNDTADLIVTNDGNDCSVQMFSHRNSTNHNTFQAYASRGTASSRATVVDGDSLLRILGRGYNTSAGTYNPSVEIAFEVDGEPNTSSDASDMPGRIVFKTALNGTSSESNRMVIKNDGLVGIGTDNPAYALDVRDGIVFAGRAISDAGSISYTNTAAVFSSRGVDQDASETNILRLMRDGTSGVQYAGVADFNMSEWESAGVNSRTQLTLNLGHGDLNSLETADVMTWRSNGYVGIGSTGPTTKLEINEASGYTGYEFITLSRAEPTRYRSTIGFGDYASGNKFGLSFTTRNNNVDYRTMTMVDGNVGIGTDSPGAKLDVRGQGIFHGSSGSYLGTNVGAITINSNVSDDTHAFSQGLVFTNNTSGAGPWTHAAITTEGSTGYRGDLVFGTDGDGTNNTTGITEKMRIRHDGSVGIGTTSPTSSLELPAKDKAATTTHHGLSGYAGINLTIPNTTGRINQIVWTNEAATSHGYGSIGMEMISGTGVGTGDMIFSTKGVGTNASSTERLRITSDGFVKIGQNSVNYPGNGNTTTGVTLTNTGRITASYAGDHVFNRNSDGILMSWRRSGGEYGSVSISNTSGTTYNTTSDRRLKTDIQPIAGATDTLMAMAPVTHKWKAHPSAPAVYGFIAQEMQVLVPEAVSGNPDSDEMMGMDYGRITPVIVAALQDALNEIKELKTRIKQLENK